MPRFPKSQAQIAALAEQLWRGLLDNNAIFSQPLVHTILIRIRKIIYHSPDTIIFLQLKLPPSKLPAIKQRHLKNSSRL